MLAVASGLSLQTTGLVVLITGLALYCPLSEALFGAGAQKQVFLLLQPASMSVALTYEAGTSFNPLNNAAFAMAGRGRSAVHLGRMVCPHFHRHSYFASTKWPGPK